MAATNRDLSLLAAICLSSGALLSVGILGITLWGMRLDYFLRLIRQPQMPSFFGGLAGMFAASLTLAFFASRFWTLSQLSRWWVLSLAAASAIAICLVLNWFCALYSAVAACLLAVAQRSLARSHA
jgi:hypothetical protein